MKKLRENISKILTQMPLPFFDQEKEMKDLLLDLQAKLTILSTVLESSEYPCPICSHYGRENPGTVKLCWDIEYEDYYPIYALPYFESTCKDPDPKFGEVRQRIGWRIDGSVPMLPFNHGEQMSRTLADGGDADLNASNILGAAQERRRIAEMLGIRLRKWGE